MDEIINIIYSDKNLNKLSEKFTSFFDDIGDTPNAQNACKTWLKKKMGNIFEQNRNNLRGDKREIIKKLNSDCLKLAVTEYRNNQNGKTTGQNLNKYKMDRDKEIYGNRKNKLERRPKYRDENKLGTISDTGGFASFSNNDSGFIAADGSTGKEMFFGNLNEKMQMGDKKSSMDD